MAPLPDVRAFMPNDPLATNDSNADDADHDVREVLAELMPWGVSIVLHALLVTLAICVVWISIREQPEEVVVPTIVSHNPPTEKMGVMAPKPFKTDKSHSSPSSLSKARRDTTPLISRTLTIDTRFIGVAGSNTSKASPFGASVGVGNGPGVFNSIGGPHVKSVAYLVDASGSLIDTFPFVLAELRRSIGELNESQSFTVIFFQGDRVIESPAPGLKKATTQNRQRVIQWLSPSPGSSQIASGNTSGGVTPMGSANPVAALKQALRYRPDLVFLLSDNITGEGQYEVNQKALLDEVRRANVAGTKINTLQFLYPDPLTRFGFKGTMDLIAAESGGVATFVSGADLAIE
jgi:hypothetical protein